jgi:hypothetical protein
LRREAAGCAPLAIPACGLVRSYSTFRRRVTAPRILSNMEANGHFFSARAPLLRNAMSRPEFLGTGDLCGLCQLRPALKRPFLARLSPRVVDTKCRRADITFQALYIHCNRIAYLRHKVSASCACAVFCHSEPKLATLKFLRRQKNLPPTAVNQKHPGFGRFSPSPFERRFDFFL